MQDHEEHEEIKESTEEPEEATSEEVEPKPAPAQPSDELKVVINIKADRAMLGVQSPNCDPVYTTIKGSLAVALKKVPALVAKAKQKWEATPRYPKADLPEPAPSTTPARTSVASQPAKPKNQPSFF